MSCVCVGLLFDSFYNTIFFGWKTTISRCSLRCTWIRIPPFWTIIFLNFCDHTICIQWNASLKFKIANFFAIFCWKASHFSEFCMQKLITRGAYFERVTTVLSCVLHDIFSVHSVSYSYTKIAWFVRLLFFRFLFKMMHGKEKKIRDEQAHTMNHVKQKRQRARKL